MGSIILRAVCFSPCQFEPGGDLTRLILFCDFKPGPTAIQTSNNLQPPPRRRLLALAGLMTTRGVSKSGYQADVSGSRTVQLLLRCLKIKSNLFSNHLETSCKYLLEKVCLKNMSDNAYLIKFIYNYRYRKFTHFHFRRKFQF